MSSDRGGGVEEKEEEEGIERVATDTKAVERQCNEATSCFVRLDRLDGEVVRDLKSVCNWSDADKTSFCPVCVSRTREIYVRDR